MKLIKVIKMLKIQNKKSKKKKGLLNYLIEQKKEIVNYIFYLLGKQINIIQSEKKKKGRKPYLETHLFLILI